MLQCLRVLTFLTPYKGLVIQAVPGTQTLFWEFFEKFKTFFNELTEVYLVPYQAPTMELFYKNI